MTYVISVVICDVPL